MYRLPRYFEPIRLGGYFNFGKSRHLWLINRKLPKLHQISCLRKGLPSHRGVLGDVTQRIFVLVPSTNHHAQRPRVIVGAVPSISSAIVKLYLEAVAYGWCELAWKTNETQFGFTGLGEISTNLKQMERCGHYPQCADRCIVCARLTIFTTSSHCSGSAALWPLVTKPKWYVKRLNKLPCRASRVKRIRRSLLLLPRFGNCRVFPVDPV